MGFPGGSVGKESACNEGDLSSVPGLGRSPEEGNGNKLLFKTSDMKLSENIIHGYYRLANYEIVVVLVVQRCLALCNSWTVAR